MAGSTAVPPVQAPPHLAVFNIFAASKSEPPATMLERMQGAFDHAQYVWLSGLNKHRVAWTPQLTSYFDTHFTRIMRAGPAGSLYRRIGLKPAR